MPLLAIGGEIARRDEPCPTGARQAVGELAEQRAIATLILGLSAVDLGHVASAMDPLVVAHEALQRFP